VSQGPWVPGGGPGRQWQKNEGTSRCMNGKNLGSRTLSGIREGKGGGGVVLGSARTDDGRGVCV